jgi:ribonuclease P protein component
MERLTRRGDFLAARGGPSHVTAGLIVQGRDRGDPGPWRVGFTVTRRLGNAVKRNRIRRRLRELARRVLGERGREGFDYVLIGRAATRERPFERLVGDLERALDEVHARAETARGSGGKPD